MSHSISIQFKILCRVALCWVSFCWMSRLHFLQVDHSFLFSMLWRSFAEMETAFVSLGSQTSWLSLALLGWHLRPTYFSFKFGIIKNEFLVLNQVYYWRLIWKIRRYANWVGSFPNRKLYRLSTVDLLILT